MNPDRPLHIAIVRDAHITGGGISRVAESWARILGTAGHTVTLVSESHEAARALPPIPNLRQVVYERVRTKRRASRIAARARAAAEATLDLARSSPVDLLISHTAATTIALRRLFPRAPLLQSFHSPMVDENRLNNWKYTSSAWRRLTYPAAMAYSFLVERKALRAIDGAHTLSRYTWDRLRETHAAACSKVEWRLVPGTYDDRTFVPAPDRARVRERLGLDPRATILLTVRRLVPRNGVDRILLCAERLGERFPDARFLIGGAGRMRDALERRVEESRLAGRVRLLGFIPDDLLAAHYQAADVFLLPTKDLECFGLPVIEAMGCGCTPLISPGGGPSEILEDRPAWVAAANRDDAFVDLVGRYLAGSIATDPAGVARDAAARYSETAVTPGVLEIVERIASRGTAARGLPD